MGSCVIKGNTPTISKKNKETLRETFKENRYLCQDSNCESPECKSGMLPLFKDFLNLDGTVHRVPHDPRGMVGCRCVWCSAETAVYKGDYWTATGRRDGLLYFYYYYYYTLTSSSTSVSGSVYSASELYQSFLDGE